MFSSLSKRSTLRDILKLSTRDARTLECRILLASSAASRSHGALQDALATAMYLNQLIGPCKTVGVDITAAAQFESAQVLWSQGEMTASVRLLRELNSSLIKDILGPQTIPVGKAELLATLVGGAFNPVIFVEQTYLLYLRVTKQRKQGFRSQTKSYNTFLRPL